MNWDERSDEAAKRRYSDYTTMTDELRDRIADVLSGHPIGSGDYETSVGREEALDMADEVIDDLGLIVERTVRVADHGAGPLRVPQTRVVGKWER